MKPIVEPLNPQATRTHQRILEKLACVLSDEIKRRERKLAKCDKHE